MDLDEAMRTTFSAREFTADPLPDAALADILDRARFAPSGGNRQGWKVIVVRDNATREALARLTEPAAKRYIPQQKNGEHPWNTIHPPRVAGAAVMPGGRRAKQLTTLKRRPVTGCGGGGRGGGPPLA